MTHKHENDVIDAVDFMKPSYAERKHKAIQVEVDEVYRKAKAFDEIQKYHKEYMNVMQKQFDKDLRGSNLHVISVGSAVLNYFAEAEEASQ